MDKDINIDELFAQAREQEKAAREKAAHDQRMIDGKKVDERVGEIYATAQERQEFSTKLQKANEENNRRVEKAKIHEDEISSLEKQRAEAQAKIESEDVDDAAKETYRKILEIVDLRLSEAETKKAGVQEEISKSQSEMDANAEDLKKKIQKDKETLGFDSDVHNILGEIENERYAEQHKTEIEALKEELLKIQVYSSGNYDTSIRPSPDIERRIKELSQYPLVFEKFYKALADKKPSLTRAAFEIDGKPVSIDRLYKGLVRNPLLKRRNGYDSRINRIIKKAIENPDMTTEEILAEMGSKYESEVLAAIQDDANKDNERFDTNRTLNRESENIEYYINDLTGRLEYKQNRYDSAVAELEKYKAQQGMVDAWQAFVTKLDSYGIREFSNQNYYSLEGIYKRKKEDLERQEKPALFDFSGKKEFRAKEEELEKMARAIKELEPYKQKIENAVDEYGQKYSIEPRTLDEYKRRIVSIEKYQLKRLEAELAEADENLKAHKAELATWQEKKKANQQAREAV